LRFACRITKARKHAHNIEYILIHSWLIPSYLVIRFTATQQLRKRAATYLCLRSGQPNCMCREGHKQTKFFYLNVATGTLHEDPRTFYCRRRHKCAIKALLCNTQYFLYSWQWHVAQQHTHTHRTHCSITTATMMKRTRYSVISYVHCLLCRRKNCELTWVSVWKQGIIAQINNYKCFNKHCANIKMVLSQFSRKSCSNNIRNINGADDSSVLEAGRAYGTVHLADPTSKLI